MWHWTFFFLTAPTHASLFVSQSQNIIDIPSALEMGQTTLRISSTHSSLTLPSLHQGRSRFFEPQTPDTARLSPRESRVSSFLRLSPSHSRRASVNGIDHALKLNFLSTLGPGIPVTPTASVFGDGLNNFIRRDPSNPGGLFGYTPEEEKRVVHKIDWRIIPILGMFYAASTLSEFIFLPFLVRCFARCFIKHGV